MSDDRELIERVAMALARDNHALIDMYSDDAERAIAAMRAFDREQRAKIDEFMAPKGDPDDYRDPLTLVTRMDRAPGIMEG